MLINGDCLDLLETIEAGSVDAIIADLPYGTTACKWDAVIPFEPMWREFRRVTKPNAAIVLTASQPFTSALGASNIAALRYSWVWRKSRPTGQMNAKRMPLKDAEDVLVFYRAAPTYNPQGTRSHGVTQRNTAGRIKRSSVANNGGQLSAPAYLQEATNYPRQVLDFPSVHNVGAFHPTQKPVDLMEYLIRTYTNEGEVVLDPTMGSGTTGVACVNTGRRFIGIERDADYFAIAQRRIAEAMPSLLAAAE
jgi:DNA modification methylase